MGGVTTRLGNRYPFLSDTADVPRDIENLAEDTDDAAIFGIGTLATRPTSASGIPGIAGRFYYANDAGASAGDLWFDYGTGYRQVALRQTTGSLDLGSTGYYQTSNATFGLRYTPPANAGTAVSVQIAGEANARFGLWASGQLNWGPGGSSGYDTNLYRSAANTLQTDDKLVINGADASAVSLFLSSGYLFVQRSTSGQIAAGFRISGDTQQRLIAYSDGSLMWGDGTNVGDTKLYRNAASSLKTDGSFSAASGFVVPAASGPWGFAYLGSPVLGNYAFLTEVAGDTQPRFIIKAGGEVDWGAGGSSALDTSLWRSAPGIVQFGALGGGTAQITIDPGGGNSVNQIAALQLKARTAAGVVATSTIYSDSNGNIVNRSGNGAFFYEDGASNNFALLTETSGWKVSSPAASWAFRNHLLYADTQPAFAIFGNGQLSWGPGGVTATDVSMKRYIAGTMLFGGGTGDAGGTIRTQNAAATQDSLQSLITGSAQLHFRLRADGVHLWGPGTVGPDVGFLRSGTKQMDLTDAASGWSTLRLGTLVPMTGIKSPGIRVSMAAAQAAADTAQTGILFGNTDRQTSPLGDNSEFTKAVGVDGGTTITVHQDGWYGIAAFTDYGVGLANVNLVTIIKVNNNEVARSFDPGQYWRASSSYIGPLSSGDVIEIYTYHDGDGVAHNVVSGTCTVKKLGNL